MEQVLTALHHLRGEEWWAAVLRQAEVLAPSVGRKTRRRTYRVLNMQWALATLSRYMLCGSAMEVLRAKEVNFSLAS